MDEIDICIIGGGVIGTAIARQIQLTFPHLDTLLIERNHKLGMITSSRNSEVLHAGLYYPPQSLKAKHCLNGHRMLLQFCKERDITCRKIGKLVVASRHERHRLEAILKNAQQCGVHSLRRMQKAALQEFEPNIDVEEALFSPETAIIDSHHYLQALQADIPSTSLVPGTKLINAEPLPSGQKNGFVLSFNDSSGVTVTDTLKTRLLINAAGLAAPALATQIYKQLSEKAAIPSPAWLAGKFEYSKGNYYNYTGKSPFSRLVYPVPPADGRGLGIHATLDVSGQCRFGPDVEKLQLACGDIEAANTSGADIYQVDEGRRDAFIQQISRYFPALNPDRLQPDYSGIRCQWRSPQGHTDFQIDDQLGNGIGLLQYLGIDSPGLTSSLSLAVDAVTRIKNSPFFNCPLKRS